MREDKKAGKELRTSKIEYRTTPAIKEKLKELAEKGFRSPAQENERLIIEAHSKL